MCCSVDIMGQKLTESTSGPEAKRAEEMREDTCHPDLLSHHTMHCFLFS